MSGFEGCVIKSVVKRDGYEVRTLLLENIETVQAFTPEGLHLGRDADAIFLIAKGIKPELRTPTSNTCSIGFCEREQKWYGWSHRAICGFGVGSVSHGVVAETLADAWKMADAFAESVR